MGLPSTFIPSLYSSALFIAGGAAVALVAFMSSVVNAAMVVITAVELSSNAASVGGMMVAFLGT